MKYSQRAASPETPESGHSVHTEYLHTEVFPFLCLYAQFKRMQN